MRLHRKQGRGVQRADQPPDYLRQHEEAGVQLQLPAGAHPQHRVRHHPRPQLQPHHLPLHKLHKHHQLHADPQRQDLQGHRRRCQRHVPHGRPPHAPALHHHPGGDLRGRHHLQQPGPPLVVRTVRRGRDEGDMGDLVRAPGNVLGYEQGHDAGRLQCVQENKLHSKEMRLLGIEKKKYYCD